jgi:hypothetical protein
LKSFTSACSKMARKPENTFINSVHKHFGHARPYTEKMNNPYRGGTADTWYSGTKADLWVEYKYIARIPQRAGVLPDCSPLQLQWLKGRSSEGRNVAVIVGCPTGGVVYLNGAWEYEVSGADFSALVVPRPTIAGWITYRTVKRAQCPSFEVFTQHNRSLGRSLAF